MNRLSLKDCRYNHKYENPDAERQSTRPNHRLPSQEAEKMGKKHLQMAHFEVLWANQVFATTTIGFFAFLPHLAP